MSPKNWGLKARLHNREVWSHPTESERTNIYRQEVRQVLTSENPSQDASRGEVTIRSLHRDDFPFVQQLAGRQPSFTTPSPYLIWMFGEVEHDACFVATCNNRPVGYVLGQITPTGTLWVWQLAVERHAPAQTGRRLVERLREVCLGYSLKRLTFTMSPRLAERWAAHSAMALFNSPLRCVGEAGAGESIYEIRLGNKPDGLSRPYALSGFPEFVQSVFTGDALNPLWRQALEHLKPHTILEIGAGHGRLTPWLLDTGAGRVVALEPDPNFLRSLRNHPRIRDDKRLSIVNGRFPSDSLAGQRFACIVMHQNVLLEIVNQEPLDRVVAELSRALADGGVILFDYTVNLRPGYPGTIHTLFDGDILGLGQVNYLATYRGWLPGTRHAADLHFVHGDSRRIEQKLNIEFFHPDLEDVLGAFNRAECRTRWMADLKGHTFFPADMKLVTIGRN